MTEPAVDVLGLPLVGMPDDVTPLAALVVVKALDADGKVAYYARATDGVTTVEAVGMGIYGVDQLREALRTGEDEQ
jgi:hypothetical protein